MSRSTARSARRPLVLVATALLAAALAPALAGCSGPILANAPAARPPLPAEAPPTPAPSPDPQRVVLPRDDGPHDRLTEWWYYTGHLRTPDGRELGFEDVVFRAERGDFPVSWASHVAITDEAAETFHYAQRGEIGPQADRSPLRPDGEPAGFDLSIAGYDPSDPATVANPPWTMRGSGGSDVLAFELSPTEASAAGVAGGMALDLTLTPMKPATLHDIDGYADFGPAGGSYYYSRTRLEATGTVVIDGIRAPVEGSVWFDHQWGDFIAIGGGGWDWFAIELDDGTDLMVNRVRAADGAATHVPTEAISIDATGTWTSPATGATYPSGWRVRLPGQGLDLVLSPTVAGQELDTRQTTGVIYWEGSAEVTGTRGGAPVRGEAYVELTGYAGSGVEPPLR